MNSWLTAVTECSTSTQNVTSKLHWLKTGVWVYITPNSHPPPGPVRPPLILFLSTLNEHCMDSARGSWVLARHVHHIVHWGSVALKALDRSSKTWLRRRPDPPHKSPRSIRSKGVAVHAWSMRENAARCLFSFFNPHVQRYRFARLTNPSR